MDLVQLAIGAILRGEAVVIASGCPEPSDATISSLTSADQIVIVVLPSGTGDPAQIAAQIDAATGGEKIIALVVGDQLYGKASRFEKGTAEDIADRASSLTKDPMVAVKIFVEKVHAYQKTAAGQAAMNPKTETGTITTTPPPEPSAVGGTVVIGGVLLTMALIAAVLWKFVLQRPSKPLVQVEAKLNSKLALTMKRWDDSPTSLGLDDMLRTVTGLEGLATQEAAALPDNTILREVHSLSNNIATNVGIIREEWPKIDANPLLAAEIRDITFKHLPETVGLYLDVPARVRHSKVKGDAPAGSLRKALEAVDARLTEVCDAIDNDALDALEVQGRFLSGKYVPNRQLNVGN